MTTLSDSKDSTYGASTYQTGWLAINLFIAMVSLYYVWQDQGQFQAMLMLLGIALGLCLFHASFGFSTAWRQLIQHRDGAGLRGQLTMLSVSVLLFFPVLANGELFGTAVNGFLRPLGPSVVVGAFIFGIGMQIANGCASGNLYHLGGGRLNALPVIAGFSFGALWATLDYEWWTTLPQFAPVGLIETLGVIPAIIANLLVFAAFYKLTRIIDASTATNTVAQDTKPLWSKVIQGPWPMIWGAVGLAILNFVTLAMLGRPWAVALAYPVWGAKAATLFGIELDLDFTTYWMQPSRESALYEPLTSDAGSLMNIGVIVGALLAASLAGRFALSFKLSLRQLLGGLLGGTMLGYGATIAYGCNIGAFIGGVISGSLHGWLWIICALAGSYLGIKLRPLFKQD